MTNKVKHALALTAASNASDAAATGPATARGSSSAERAGAVLPLLKRSEKEAILTVREAVKNGSSFVMLATVNLPLVAEVTALLIYPLIDPLTIVAHVVYSLGRSFFFFFSLIDPSAIVSQSSFFHFLFLHVFGFFACYVSFFVPVVEKFAAF